MTTAGERATAAGCLNINKFLARVRNACAARSAVLAME
jgi:hypothetical protein